MPLTRYEIRNEYSLADPELYRAADKDDPEALLEGVAMAGLVGVLRQLGDLAEFAAEIFHDLHEELMATAARGHDLTVRVQQIETEFPAIEKAFLSQTSHSSFFYNTGVDWHPNVHMGQNLVTQGDLPRFVMDSYEECRGPPRLFLLDKFDVAGAGSCLKRYTDPSFFKAESPLSVIPNTEVQREKKGRKSKKKGSRWRNGGTPEVLSTSHVKLQQLFLEERIENHVSDPARRVKLKRRLNGSPFDSAMGKSYMDAFLKIPTPDPDVVREIPLTSSPLNMAANVAGITRNGVDIGEISPDKITQQRKRSLYSSSDSEAGHKLSIHDLAEEDYGTSPKFSLTQTNDISPTLHEVDKQEIVSEGARKIEGSDDEVENYVDALTTMDSEIETDTEHRAKNEMQILNANGKRMGSDATEELYDFAHSTDSQSIGNSSQMDGNVSSGKGKSVFSYSGSFDLAENVPSEGNVSPNTVPSAEHCEAEIASSSSDRYSFKGNTPLSEIPSPISQDNCGNENENIPSYKNEIGELSSSSCVTESGAGDPGEHFTEVSSLGRELDGVSSNHSNSKSEYVNGEEDSICLDENISGTYNYDGLASQTRDAAFSKLSSNSMEELNYHDIHKSHASLHLPRVVQLASDKDSDEDLRNDMIQGEYPEEEHSLTSVANLDLSLTRSPPLEEEFARPENETCSPHLEPKGSASEETASRSSPILDRLEVADLVEMQLQKPENDHSHDPGVGFSHIQEAKFAETYSSEPNGEEIGELSFGNDLIQKDHNATNLSSATQSLPDSPHAVDDGIEDIIHLQAKDVATSVADINFDDNGGDVLSSDPICMKSLEERSLVQDLHQNGIHFNEDHHHESSTEEMMNEQADVTSGSVSISSKTPSSDYSDLDLSHRVTDLSTTASSRNSLHVDKDNAIKSSYQDPEDADAKTVQKMIVTEEDEDAHSLLTHRLVDISISPDQQVELYNSQSDGDTCHDQASDSVFVEEDTKSSPVNHLSELSVLDQEVEPQNGNLAVNFCHMINDQVSESKYSHQPVATADDEDVSSPTCHIVEPGIPVEKCLEIHREQFDLEDQYDQISESTSAQNTNVIENEDGIISSPTHHKAELRDSLEQRDESLGHAIIEPCRRQYSDSEFVQRINVNERAEDDVSPFTHDTKQEFELQNKNFDEKSSHDQGSELERLQQIEVVKSSETAVSSNACCIMRSTAPIDQTVELQDHFDENSKDTINGNTNPPLIPQGESLTSNTRERESDPSIESSALYHPTQPLLSQFLPQFDLSKPAEDLLGSKFPSFGFLPEVPLDEMPPLPPLPPMQWRLGKVQHTFPAPERNSLQHNLSSFPPLISMPLDKSQSCDPAREADISSLYNPSSSYSSLEDHNSQDKNVKPADHEVHFADPISQKVPELVTIASRLQVPTPGVVLPIDHSVKCEDVSLESKRGTFQLSIEDTQSALPFCYLSEQTVKPLGQSSLSTSSRLDENIQEEAIDCKEKTVNIPSTVISLPVTEEHEKQHVLSTPKEGATYTSSSSVSLPPSEDGMPNGNRQIKLPRPRNPLIDAVVAHDKSKLRKVTQLPQPQIGQQAEERDSLLEQIRAKSFNLKPAAVSRPSIQGPKTNLRVAAILEKANAIRQACAGTGSDEDDEEDGWSDS